MLAALIALALGQFAAPPTPPGPGASASAVFPTADDLAFAIATEDWVRQARGVRRLDDALGHADADLIRRLACNHYACRAAAVREIEAKGDGAFRLLFYGKRHVDAQVRTACESLFADRYLCKLCGGSRRCPHPGATGFPDCSACTYGGVCPECRGNGLARRFPPPARKPPVYVNIER